MSKMCTLECVSGCVRACGHLVKWRKTSTTNKWKSIRRETQTKRKTQPREGEMTSSYMKKSRIWIWITHLKQSIWRSLSLAPFVSLFVFSTIARLLSSIFSNRFTADIRINVCVFVYVWQISNKRLHLFQPIMEIRFAFIVHIRWQHRIEQFHNTTQWLLCTTERWRRKGLAPITVFFASEQQQQQRWCWCWCWW